MMTAGAEKETMEARRRCGECRRREKSVTRSWRKKERIAYFCTVSVAFPGAKKSRLVIVHTTFQSEKNPPGKKYWHAGASLEKKIRGGNQNEEKIFLHETFFWHWSQEIEF